MVAVRNSDSSADASETKNEKMAKRKAQQDVRRAVKAKKDAKDNEWRSVLEKERKKSKYREEGKAEKLRALRAQTS